MSIDTTSFDGTTKLAATARTAPCGEVDRRANSAQIPGLAD
jgi:hypothetical protein